MYKSQTEGTDDRRVGRQKMVDETGEEEGGQSCNAARSETCAENMLKPFKDLFRASLLEPRAEASEELELPRQQESRSQAAAASAATTETGGGGTLRRGEGEGYTLLANR